MPLRISRQSEHYGTEAAREHLDQTQGHSKHVHSAMPSVPSHLVGGPGIGRLGVDPLE